MVAVPDHKAFATDLATQTNLGLLDALIEAMTLARPGVDAAQLAGDLRRLGAGAERCAAEVEALLAPVVATTVDVPGPLPELVLRPRVARAG
jgi:hypothetical protein